MRRYLSATMLGTPGPRDGWDMNWQMLTNRLASLAARYNPSEFFSCGLM
jgi:hypothetical protein